MLTLYISSLAYVLYYNMYMGKIVELYESKMSQLKINVKKYTKEKYYNHS